MRDGMKGKTRQIIFWSTIFSLLIFFASGELQAKSKRVVKKTKKQSRLKKNADSDNSEIGVYRRKRVEVIQDRMYNKKNKSEFSLGLSLIPDNSFYFYTMVDIKYTYHFTEYLGVEGDFSYIFDSKKDLLTSIENTFNQTVQADILEYYYGGEFIFTPLYGKFAFLTKDILHWDFFVEIGVGAFNTELQTRFAGNFGVGMHVIFNKWLAGRFDFRNYTYRETVNYIDNSGTTVNSGSVVNAKQFQFGISAYFPHL